MNTYTWTPGQMVGWLRHITRLVDEGHCAEAELPDLRMALDEAIRFLPELRESISEESIALARSAE